jgi:hypothetical protein
VRDGRAAGSMDCIQSEPVAYKTSTLSVTFQPAQLTLVGPLENQARRYEATSGHQPAPWSVETAEATHVR